MSPLLFDEAITLWRIKECIFLCGNTIIVTMQSKTLFYCQAAEALSQAARNDSQAARVDREAMSVGGKDSEAEAFDFNRCRVTA